MSAARPVYRYRPLGSALFGGPVGGRRPAPRIALGDTASLLFPASVQRWSSLVQQYAGSIPLPFLLAWIQKESAGNPCSYTSLHESGIWQLMPPGNTNVAGTTEAALRAACVGATQTASRPLTADEATHQVKSGLQYVNWAKDYARQYVNWPESNPDFWKMVKMVHVAPARVKEYAPGASSWAEFRRRAAAGGDTPASWLDNAEWVGNFGTGGGASSALAILVFAGLVAGGTVLYLRSRSRR